MRRAFPLAAVLLAAASAFAQQTPEDQARRLLEDGRAYRAQGKAKQALDNFNIVVSSFPGTAAVGAKDAKRLKLKGRRNRSVAVATGSRTVAARRRATVELTFTTDAKRRLAAAPSVKLTLRISVKTALGGTGSGRTTTLTLRR